MDPAADAGDEAFSPMRAARAGRRAGKHVAIADPSAVALAATFQEPVSSSSGSGAETAQQPVLRQLSSQRSQRGRQPQADMPELQQLQEQQEQSVLRPQPPPAQLQPQQQPPQQQQQRPQQQGGSRPDAGPPPKRVGFDLSAGAGGDEQSGTSGQQQHFAGVSRRKQGQMQQQEISAASHRDKYEEKAVDRFIDIPELEDEGREDIRKMIAQAPKVAPRVQAISELEQDQGWLPSKAADGDIDLSLLTACLVPSQQVYEAPDVWDYDLLFSALKAELTAGGAAAGDGARDDKEELRQI